MKEFWSTRAGKISLLSLLALLAFLYFKYCRQSGEKPPTKITITEAVKAPVAVAFIDANRLSDAQVGVVKVTLVDPGNMVVTSNGLPFKEISISGGVMGLALKQSAKFSPEKPYRFTLIAESTGYSTNQLNILVSTDAGQYAPIFMAKLDAPPPGMAGVTGTVPLVAGRVSATGASLTDLATPVANTVNIGNMRINIPAGAEPIYCGRGNSSQPYPSKLNFRVAYASPLSLEASRTFPGGALVTDAVGANDSIIATPGNPMFFASAGWVNIEMDADGDQVSGFTKPVTVTMPIPDTLRNPKTGQYFKPTETIDIWSLNNRGVWRQEGMATVAKGTDGKLSANMTVTHFSTWNLDYKVDVCGDPDPATHATINYTNPQSAVFTGYTEVLNGGTLLRSRYLDYDSGNNSHDLFNFPQLGNFSLRLYQDGPGTPVVTNSTNFTCGSPNATIVIPGGGGTNISVQVEVGPLTEDGEPLCNQSIWYRSCCNLLDVCGIANVTPFHFGGILQQNADEYSEVIISKPSPVGVTDINCIRIWQSELVGGVTNQAAFDIPFDFLNSTAATPTLVNNCVKSTFDGSNNPPLIADPAPEIYYWRTGVAPNFVYHFRIASGLTIMNPCPVQR